MHLAASRTQRTVYQFILTTTGCYVRAISEASRGFEGECATAIGDLLASRKAHTCEQGKAIACSQGVTGQA
jgi:hypothetical protein